MAPEVRLETSLDSKLDKIRSPKLENQKQKAVVLDAVESTLREQGAQFTPAAYFAALLALLGQSFSNGSELKKRDLAGSTVYLLDIITPYTTPALLRTKFQPILTLITPILSESDIDAPLVRSTLGLLESLLLAQDAAAWAIHQAQVGPRSATVLLLKAGIDSRPKVRKRALDALTRVLQNGPPSPSLDHPVADLCAQTALRNTSELASIAELASQEWKFGEGPPNQPALIHSLQVIKAIAVAAGGWPSKKIESLCELLLNISKSKNDFLSMATFDVFEVIFAGMATDVSSSKLSRMIEVIKQLRPGAKNSALLPPWLAVLSRGYIVSVQVEAQETFEKLPELFSLMSESMSSPFYHVRTAASECLVSLIANCIPDTVLLNPSVYDDKVLEKLAKIITSFLSVKYQMAWMETLGVVSSIFDALRWRSSPLMDEAIQLLGDLRQNDSFTGNKEVDTVLGSIINAIGPERFLDIMPLNLKDAKQGQPGRVWLLPILRDNVNNTRLAHFRSDFVPLSEFMFQKILDRNGTDKTMETKIFETIVQQIWDIFPGYCDLPLDLVESFDQSLAELLSSLLYTQVGLRVNVCKGLQSLVDSNKAIVDLEGEEDDLLLQRRVSKASARLNINHLAGFAENILAVLFNVYSQTLPHHRGYILNCINSFLSVISHHELVATFERVVSALEAALLEEGPQTQAEKQKAKKTENQLPPMSHTLVDLIITMSIYLPRETFGSLFSISALMIAKQNDPQLQKKAYKLIPRLELSEIGRKALKERNQDLQKLLIESAEKTSPPAKRDRMNAIGCIVPFMSGSDLSFIPNILSEVVIACKETNEKARIAAFDLLVKLGHRMQQGGIIVSSNILHRSSDATDVPASMDEYLTMISAGLAGNSPHTISASVVALSRCLYEFKDKLSESAMSDLVSTLDLFLTSQNREIVRSALGFVKVAILLLPKELMLLKLDSLIPNILRWSHEHQAHLRSKVKHMLERLVRRFGLEIVDKHTPEDDKKLIRNIRKSRDRQKQTKGDVMVDGSDESEREKNAPRLKRGNFESEFDKAIYESSSDSEAGGETNDLPARKKRKDKNNASGTYIVEDDDEPLDLLSSNALAKISSLKPMLRKGNANGLKHKRDAKVNVDGKIVIGKDDSEDEDAEMIDFGEDGKGTAVDAYVDAVAGKDAVQRGQRGKLKFKNKAGQEDMELDGEDVEATVAAAAPRRNGKQRQGKNAIGVMDGKNGTRPQQWRGVQGRVGKKRDFKSMRRGLGVPRAKAGKVGGGRRR